jgi:tRNA nucleotidyltransferase (CCA-adding enzyme)
VQDPLRVFRAVQFSSRFEFKLDKNLFELCQNMVEEKSLEELSMQRIKEELKKLLLKSNRPSIGLKLLKRLNINIFDINLEILTQIDYFSSFKTQDNKTNIIIFMTLLYSNNKQYLDILNNSKKLKKEVLVLINIADYFLQKTNTIAYNEAKYLDLSLVMLYFRAINIDVDLRYLKPKLHGKDLLARGYKQSKEFTKILQESYNSQLINHYE